MVQMVDFVGLNSVHIVPGHPMGGVLNTGKADADVFTWGWRAKRRTYGATFCSDLAGEYPRLWVVAHVSFEHVWVNGSWLSPHGFILHQTLDLSKINERRFNYGAIPPPLLRG